MKFVQVIHYWNCHQIIMWHLVFLVTLALVGSTSPPKDCSVGPNKGPISEPLRCPLNEHFEDCPDNCPPQNCSSMYKKYDCSKFPKCCVPQCRCDDGYSRSDLTGQCLTTDQCSISCGANAHYAVNDSTCRWTCANYDLRDTAGACKPYTGCVCDDGYVRLNDDATGMCVRPEGCPSRQCPCNEHWAVCPRHCPDDTCKTNEPGFICKQYFVPPPCKARCICDEGYLRNEQGLCIPFNECPDICPKHEHWDDCPKQCPRDSCAKCNPKFKCPQLPAIPLPCYPDCVCDKDYLRDPRGICIPEKKCPNNQTCGVNEVFNHCKIICPPQTCASIYTLYNCIRPQPCVPGCDCLPKYLRNEHGVCIRSEQCSREPPSPPTKPECGVNRVYKKCGPTRPDTCDSINIYDPQSSVDGCASGCFCIDGYVENKKGDCIPVDECPALPCPGSNEIYKRCGPGCDKTCKDNNRTCAAGADACVPGCYCAKGYARDYSGVCIRLKDCPPQPVCLLENEEFNDCGSSCPDTCENYKDKKRICTLQCVRGCFCKKGYVRRGDGLCVEPGQCPKECGFNEKYNYCGSHCPITCANRLLAGDWACIASCKEGCDCVQGTMRNDSGICVPLENCTPPKCRANEEYKTCGTACPDTCHNYKDEYRPCTKNCVEDCFCRKGYVRNDDWRCVKPDKCPSQPQCSSTPHEVFSPCSAHCADTCENYNSPNRVCTFKCTPGCVCENGYVRRNDGQCVKPQECTPKTVCSRKHEEFSKCGAACQRTCDNYKKPNLICPAICQPGCVCKPGYVRRNDGRCIKPQHCPNVECPKHEHWDSCPSLCPRDSCAGCNPDFDCPQLPAIPLPCQPDCVCNKNYLRDPRGICIPKKKCPKNQTCGVNEIFKECKTTCPRQTCDARLELVKCPDKPECIPGCDCLKGYLRNKHGQCIRAEQCNTGCGVNEKYYNCTTRCPTTCRNRFIPPQPCILLCKIGCDCESGYLRHDNGTCVLPDSCSKPECPAHSSYKKCGTACPSTCRTIGKPQIPCMDICVEGCFCNQGYVKDDVGNCVRIKDCKCCPANERYLDCMAGYCSPMSCDEVGTSIACAGVSVDGKCDGGCICMEGYLRNKEGVCIPKEDCPPKPSTCPKNEKYVPCVAGYCAPLKCDELGYPVACPDIIGPCDGGCVCEDGFLRDANGTCIPKEDCPSCGGDPHAMSGCGTHCRNSCSDYLDKDKKCPELCDYNGCDCKKGYVYDEVTKKCVKPENCPGPNTCPKNEKYVDCVLGHCVAKKCADLGYPIQCPDIVGPCDGGCVCVAGYVRNDKGLCIPKNECPSCRGDYNATSGCGNHCGNTCKDYKIKDKKCPIGCAHNGCNCKVGFVFDQAIKKCVKPKDCSEQCDDGSPPKCECGPNENYADCKTECSNDYCPKNDSRAPVTCTTPDPCKPGCICKLNHKRSNTDGKCIVSSTCPAIKCKRPNETYDSCPSACLAEDCADVDNQPTTCNTLVLNCEPRCVCQKGYFRNKDDICVLAKDCPCE